MLHDHILKNSEIFGMNFDFDRVLDGLYGTILDFDLDSLSINISIPPKTQNIFVCFYFSKNVQDMKVMFNISIRHKFVFSVHKQDILMIFV